MQRPKMFERMVSKHASMEKTMANEYAQTPIYWDGGLFQSRNRAGKP